jgi:hypothetical protein
MAPKRLNLGRIFSVPAALKRRPMRTGGAEDESKKCSWPKCIWPAFSRLNSTTIPAPVMVHFAFIVNLNPRAEGGFVESAAWPILEPGRYVKNLTLCASSALVRVAAEISSEGSQPLRKTNLQVPSRPA